MNQVTIREWTDALRSGVYAQTKGQLAKNDGYCCLGVLCDLLDPYGWVETADGKAISSQESGAPLHFLPDFHITKQLDKVLDAFQTNVAHMNDNGKSFEDIADVIESAYDKEYVITLREEND